MNRARPYAGKAIWTALSLAWLAVGSWQVVASPLQTEAEVSPEATPQLKLIKPAEGAPGDELTVTIEGGNFSQGAYVSFSTPAIRVVSTLRASATKLEAKLQIGKKAEPGAVILYVSNPASAAVQGTFKITGEPQLRSGTEELTATQAGQPEVRAVDPPRLARGSQGTLKITGKNFAAGAKVAFSNAGILVTKTDFVKETELAAHIQVATDAATGPTSLFVVNADDREVEVPFEVTETVSRQGAAGAPAPAPASTATAAEGASALPQRFEVFNLGEGINILQTLNMPKGTLRVAGGKVRYEEGGKEVFSAGPGDIQEIGITSIAGYNTGTFHVMLKSGKTYNFAPASLRASESQSIVDTLRRLVH